MLKDHNSCTAAGLIDELPTAAILLSKVNAAVHASCIIKRWPLIALPDGPLAALRLIQSKAVCTERHLEYERNERILYLYVPTIYSLCLVYKYWMKTVSTSDAMVSQEDTYEDKLNWRLHSVAADMLFVCPMAIWLGVCRPCNINIRRRTASIMMRLQINSGFKLVVTSHVQRLLYKGFLSSSGPISMQTSSLWHFELLSCGF